MPLLLLIRHGENDYAKRGRLAGRLPGIHLNERGRKQAEDLAEALAPGTDQGGLLKSARTRLETAEPIARRSRVSVNKRPACWRQTLENGKDNRSVGWPSPGTGGWSRGLHRGATHPGGETFLQTQSRIVAALDGICAAGGRRDIVACVLHADPIKLAVAHYIGLPLDCFQRLACDTGSVTLLAVGEQRPIDLAEPATAVPSSTARQQFGKH